MAFPRHGRIIKIRLSNPLRETTKVSRMDKTVTISRSFKEADDRDKAYYQSLTPVERLEIMLELNRLWALDNNVNGDARIEKVYRIVKLK